MAGLVPPALNSAKSSGIGGVLMHAVQPHHHIPQRQMSQRNSPRAREVLSLRPSEINQRIEAGESVKYSALHSGGLSVVLNIITSKAFVHI